MVFFYRTDCHQFYWGFDFGNLWYFWIRKKNEKTFLELPYLSVLKEVLSNTRVNVEDSLTVINGSGSSLKYILTKSATSYGECSLYSQKSAPSGFRSQILRKLAMRVLTPDLRKSPCWWRLVRRRNWRPYWMHWGRGCPYRWTLRTRETPNIPLKLK